MTILLLIDGSLVQSVSQS